jgi:membrane protein
MFQKVKRFLTVDLWHMQLRHMTGAKALGVRLLRTLVAAVRGFNEDGGPIRASGLTVYTMLSIVPAMAVAFGIAQGFGLDRMLEEYIRDNFSIGTETMNVLIDYARQLLARTRGGLMAVVGIVTLLWIVVRVLGVIEESFNTVWGIKQPRTIRRKIGDYLAMVIIAPLLLSIAVTATVALSGYLSGLGGRMGIWNPVVAGLLFVVQYAAIWVLFGMLYAFMPNARVMLPAAVIAGIFAGTVYQAAQWAYITFQIGVARANAVYGSFAAVPLFIIWLQVSWSIVLFGAELSFAWQKQESLEYDNESKRASSVFRWSVAVMLLHLLLVRAREAKSPLTCEQMAAQIDAPYSLIRRVIYELGDVGLVRTGRRDDDDECVYYPSYRAEDLTVAGVLAALEERGTDRIPVSAAAPLPGIKKRLEAFRRQRAASDADVRILDL